MSRCVKSEDHVVRDRGAKAQTNPPDSLTHLVNRVPLNAGLRHDKQPPLLPRHLEQPRLSLRFDALAFPAAVFLTGVAAAQAGFLARAIGAAAQACFLA